MSTDPHDFNPRSFWTATELGKFLGIGRASAYRLMDSGEIRWHQFAGSRRIPIDAIREYLEQTAKGPAAGGVK